MQPAAAVSIKAPSPSTAFNSPPWLSTTKMRRRRRRRRKTTSKVGYAPGVIVSQIVLKPPPYSMDALEPYMSRETLETHWDRHHRAHVDTLNLRISGTHLDGMPLPHILSLSYNNGTPLPAFNHASEVWNHDFFWESMTPRGGGRPSGRLLELVNRDFGSYQRMLKQLQGAASSHLGSGWAWLAYKANRLNVGNAVNPLPSEEDNKLVITNTPNALNPLLWDYSPLLAIDVWEHAYYLDYENCRAKYVSIFMEKLVSWEVVSSRLETAIERAAQREREEERRKEDEEAEMDNSEAVEMYLDSENDSETE